MAWTTPKTWASEPLTSLDLNTYIRDNQNYFKSRVDGEAKQHKEVSSSYSTTSTSFVDVDGTNMSHTITTTGGDVRITLSAFGYVSGGGNIIYVGFSLGGTDYRILNAECSNSNDYVNLSFSHIVTGLAVGDYTFNLIWQVSGSTGYIAGDPQFDVREDIGVAA